MNRHGSFGCGIVTKFVAYNGNKVITSYDKRDERMARAAIKVDLDKAKAFLKGLEGRI